MSGYWQVEALAGGTLDLPSLTAVNGPNADVRFEADGGGSRLDLSALTSFTADPTLDCLMTVTNGGTVAAGNLQTLSGLNVTV